METYQLIRQQAAGSRQQYNVREEREKIQSEVGLRFGLLLGADFGLPTIFRSSGLAILPDLPVFQRLPASSGVFRHLPVFRSSGLAILRDLPVFRSSGLPVFRSSGLPVAVGVPVPSLFRMCLPVSFRSSSYCCHRLFFILFLVLVGWLVFAPDFLLVVVVFICNESDVNY